MATPDPLPPEIRAALEQGKLLEAIKLLRKSSGLGLKEAKDALQNRTVGSVPTKIDAASGRTSLPAEALQALRHGSKIEAIRIVREKTGLGLKEAKDAVDAHERSNPDPRPGLSPGEVPRSNGGIWIVVAAAIAMLLAWLYLSH